MDQSQIRMGLMRNCPTLFNEGLLYDFMVGVSSRHMIFLARMITLRDVDIITANTGYDY